VWKGRQDEESHASENCVVSKFGYVRYIRRLAPGTPPDSRKF
jgi:hypothetical protein